MAWGKPDSTKAKPSKKGDISFSHNLYNILGMTLLEGVKSGRLDEEKLRSFSANLGVDLGSGYSAGVGYNKYMGDLRQDLKLTISKKF